MDKRCRGLQLLPERREILDPDQLGGVVPGGIWTRLQPHDARSLLNWIPFSMSTYPTLLLFACCAFGCSEVLVEPDGEGGQSGGSNADGSTATGPDPVLADDLCNAVGQCVPSCTAALQSFQYAPCEAEGHALVLCLIENYESETCSVSECEVEKQALAACRSTTSIRCAGGGGGGSDDYCTQGAGCADGERLAACTRGDAGFVCSCFLNGLLLGECTGGTSSDQACSLKAGCCASLLGSCADCP